MTFSCNIPLWFDPEESVGRLTNEFLVDTGCSITSVGIAAAQRLGLPLPPRGAAVFDMGGTTAEGTVPLKVQIAEPRVWWTANREGDAFVWPIVYLVAPANRRGQQPLLGLGGVINTCRWTVVGPTSDIACDGFIQFEDTRPA